MKLTDYPLMLYEPKSFWWRGAPVGIKCLNRVLTVRKFPSYSTKHMETWNWSPKVIGMRVVQATASDSSLYYFKHFFKFTYNKKKNELRFLVTSMCENIVQTHCVTSEWRFLKRICVWLWTHRVLEGVRVCRDWWTNWNDSTVERLEFCWSKVEWLYLGLVLAFWKQPFLALPCIYVLALR